MLSSTILYTLKIHWYNIAHAHLYIDVINKNANSSDIKASINFRVYTMIQDVLYEVDLPLAKQIFTTGFYL